MADLSTLTERQKEIYEFIRKKIESRGYGPTVREIGEGFAIASPNGVMCHLKALEKKGLIIRDKKHARAIQLVDHRPPSRSLPLVGKVAAGSPIEAIEQHDNLDLDDWFGDPGNIALQVRGQSMIEDHIADGDVVIIRKQDSAENGQRVVALINGEATLKRFYRKKSRRTKRWSRLSSIRPRTQRRSWASWSVSSAAADSCPQPVTGLQNKPTEATPWACSIYR
jgi:repressor LexA